MQNILLIMHKFTKTIKTTTFLKTYLCTFLHKSEAPNLYELSFETCTLLLNFFLNFLGDKKHNLDPPLNPYRYRQKLNKTNQSTV